MPVIVIAFAMNTFSQIKPISEDFNYGTVNSSDVPHWYDTIATEAWSVFYDHSEDPNSPHDSESGGVGIQNGAVGTTIISIAASAPMPEKNPSPTA